MPVTLMSPPRLHRSSQGDERKVTWLELFYDLVYVAALIQLGNLLSENVNIPGVLRFIVLFVPIWWAWTGITFYMNRFVVDDLWHRMLIYIQVVAIFFLGISLEGAFGNLITQFALAYAAIRFVQVILYMRTWKHEPSTKPLTQRYVSSYLIGISLWLISAFLPMPYAAVLWMLALVVEIGVAVSKRTRSLVTLLPPDVSHMRERYGIFVIIVLGESFIKLLTNFSGTIISLDIVIFSLMNILVVFGMWWLYFSDIEGTVIKKRLFAPFAWVYAHLPLTAGITAFGVASKKLFQGLDDLYIKPNYIVLFCTAIIFYSLAMALIEAAVHRQDSPKNNRISVFLRIGIALVVGVLMLSGLKLSAIAFMSIVTGVFVMVIMIDEAPHISGSQASPEQ